MFFRYIRATSLLHGVGETRGRGALLRVTPGILTSLCSKSGGNSIKYVPYVHHCDPDHDHKNMVLKRPMSPHVTHYAPTLPAMTSIAQRATGALITFYALSLAWGSLFLSNGALTYVSIIQSLNMSGFTIFLLKLILGAPFCFHYFNALRYIAWNAGKFLDIKSVYTTSYKSMVAAGVAAFFFAII